MAVIVFRIHLEEPAIFAALEGEPNSSVSFDFIPGSAIRGMLIGQYMKNRQAIDPTDTNHRRLFFSGETLYLNAFPMMDDGHRGLPVPITWQTFKYASLEDKEAIIDNALTTEKTSNKKKSISGYTYIEATDDSKPAATVYQPQRVLNIHTRRARKSSSEQQVYRYDALAPDQDFVGVIYCHDKDIALLKDLLIGAKRVSMGGARSAGYGLISINSDYVNEYTEWNEAPHKFAGDTVVITLLSDIILRDSFGDYTSTISALATALNLGEDVEINPKSLKQRDIGGFNRKWGMPLPQIPVIQQGSVIELTGMENKHDQLRQLVSDGIGEQTIDGFGRIAVNWQQHASLTRRSNNPHIVYDKQALSDESKVLWSNIRQRINQRVVDNQMTGVVFNNNYTIKGRIARNQLSRLRIKIAEELREDTPKKGVLSDFLDDIKGKVAGRQFEDAKIGNRSLTDWLQQPVFPELGASLQERDRYVLQLVDAVLERAHNQ